MPDRSRHLRLRLPRLDAMAGDALLAGVIYLIGLMTLYGLGGESTGDAGRLIQQSWIGVLVLIAGVAPVVFRHRWPLGTVVVSGGVYALTAITDDADRGAWLLAVLACAYMLSSRAERERRRIGLVYLTAVALISATFGLSAYRGEPEAWLRYGLLELVVFGAVWYAGAEVRRRRRDRDRMAMRASDAEARAEVAAAAERSRIARELHDLVGHAISVISVQASVGEHLAESDPAQAKRALGTIQQVSKEALVEMRHLVGVLRDPDGAPVEGALAPQPGLDDLDELVAEARSAGTDVTLTVRGEPVVRSPGLGLAVFRIVQEAVDNAHKHAPGAAVAVVVDHGPDAITVEVDNDAPPPDGAERLAALGGPLGSSGFGLPGMAERVAVYEGTLDTGATADGGFRVRATLPYGDEAPTAAR